MVSAVPGQATPRGDNADEIMRLRDALADAEYQCARWVAEAAGQERRADELSQAPADATAGRCRTCHGMGTLMVPDSDGESASEQVCPDPVHNRGSRTVPDGEPLTHYFHCWRFPAHHACAVALIERQSEENDRLLVKAAGIPEPGHLLVMRGTIALRDAEIELLSARIAELAEALGEAAGHVEPVDQNSELAIGGWLELAKRYRPRRPASTGADG